MPPTTGTPAPCLHLIHDRREILLFQAASRGRKQDRFLHIDMGAVCILERSGDPPYLVQVRRLSERTLEPFVERDVRGVLAAELIDHRRELRDRREAREERLFFVGFVTTDLAREEVGDVARGGLIEMIAAGCITQGRERFFEPPMGSRQLLEGVVHHYGQGNMDCGR